MAKKSFRDPQTNILKTWGFVETNEDGDISREESEDFNLEVGKFKLVNNEWIEVEQ